MSLPNTLYLPMGGIEPFAWRILKADGTLVATDQSNVIWAEFYEAGWYQLEITWASSLTIETIPLEVNDDEVFLYPPDDLSGVQL